MSDDSVWEGLSDEDFLLVGDGTLHTPVPDPNTYVTVSTTESTISSANATAVCITALPTSAAIVIDEKQIIPNITSNNNSTNSRRKRRKQIPLLKFRYGRLWVSDFTKQLWCEQQMIFDLEPPPEFKKEEYIEPPEVAIGSSLHLVRELEVQDIVQVKVTSKEDRFAIKVINLLEAVECLLNGVLNAQREVPVFGIPFDGEVFVFGVIDELRCDSDRMEFEIVEFKTRATKVMPDEAQTRINNLQVMLYKKLLDDLINQKLTKADITKHLNLNLYSSFGKSVAAYASQFGAKTLDRLLDACFERLRALPFVSSLLVEYAYQRDGSTIGIRQVEYDETWLEDRVKWCVSYWNGQREETVGVDVEDAWKCRRCPYTAHCSTFSNFGTLLDSW